MNLVNGFIQEKGVPECGTPFTKCLWATSLLRSPQQALAEWAAERSPQPVRLAEQGALAARGLRETVALSAEVADQTLLWEQQGPEASVLVVG